MFWDSARNYSPSPAPRMSDDSCYAMEGSFADKENVPAGFDSPKTKYDGDMSLYESNSPSVMSCDGSPSDYSIRRLDDHDHNSLDSGYSACESGRSASPKSRGFSFSSLCSMDEAILDISELENDDDSPKLPEGFNKLISGNLTSGTVVHQSPDLRIERPPLRRALSLNANSPNSSRARSCLFKDNGENEARNFKRPDPPGENHSPNIKRCRMNNQQQLQRIPARTIYQRSLSAREDTIKTALQRSSTEPDLIGDFSKSFCLPLIPGKHRDLKSISPSTLARLIGGQYDDRVTTFKVVDCRYPYEFEGGHIKGAQNMYTKQQIIDELINIKIKNARPNEEESKKRHILVFHCEFSSERGPNLSRYLRNIDRSQNKDFYPFLHYPEVYLLDGGYKNFYEKYPEVCTPKAYLPMLHPDHEKNLRHFRAHSKSFKRL